ncbi:serine hydrolase domain-containing protein [Streptomyces sp. 150FB]|uniref:serine hydrolase domain-containing protein n=1 Tax=Streptomyces sp. 150FB TaxID=1576605 RepID=UPI0007C813C6|nr:serine hydrolase domain-containing protein [Streptomyces sp. 150FB]
MTPLPAPTTRTGVRRACAAGLLGAALLLSAVPPAQAAAAITATTTTTTTPVAGLDPAAVDRFISAYRAKTSQPGLEIALTHGDKVVYTKGYGEDSTGAHITDTTRMPVASLSKSFTATAVMQLVDEGKVDLDAPVDHYVSDFRLGDPRGADITVRELLNQTSGMADSAFPDLREPQAHDLKSAVTRLHGAQLAAEPGTEFNYHNPNYQVAARVVEEVSGRPFATYLHDHVFAPIGMDSTTVNTSRDAKDVTHGYVRAYGKALAADEPDWFIGGSHGVITTAADLAKWLVTQYDNGKAPDGRQVVSADAVRTTHTPPAAPSDSEYAMGWQREDYHKGPVRTAHNGELFTYTAEQILLPESGWGIVVMSDTGLSVENDSAVIADGLVALTQGQTPEVRRPSGVYADWVLAAFTLLALALGVLGVVRSRRWANRRAVRPIWRAALRLGPCALPVAALALLRELVGFVFAGRSGTYSQIAHNWLALVVFIGTAALCGAVVIGTRTVRLVAAHRGRAVPASGALDIA